MAPGGAAKARRRFRRIRRQQDDGQVFGHGELHGRVPAGSIHQQDRMTAGRNRQTDLVEMHLHRLRVGFRQDECRTFAKHRTYCAEDIGALVALIGRQARPRASLGPNAGAAILLANAGFVLEPDFDAPPLRQMAYVSLERGGEVFLKSSMTPGA